MLHRFPDTIGAGFKGERRILVVYENPSVRERTLGPMAELEIQRAIEAGMDVDWCSFTMLTDSTKADEAARKAEQADLVVFAVSPAGDLTEEIKIWIERWIGRRGEREGAVIGLIDHQSHSGEIACLKEIYLRHSALHAGMDYLSHVPSSMTRAIPDSLDSYGDRAGQVTHVLDDILHAHFRPSTGLT